MQGFLQKFSPMRFVCLLPVLVSLLSAAAAELTIDFSDTKAGTAPEGFKALRAGAGAVGNWEVVTAKIPSAFEPLSPQAPRTAVEAVLTQTIHDPTDERFPMLVYEREEFGDFTLSTRFRITGGKTEQMAGIAFRLQDEENFYVIRVSALGQNIRFYKVVSGLRGQVIGPTIEITTNAWHELTINCEGNQILCSLNGNRVMPALQDTSFTRGRIAFWTKSDSQCQFVGARIVYTRLIPLSTRILELALTKYSRVQDLRLYTLPPEGGAPRVVASKEASDVGLPGEAEAVAIHSGHVSVGKTKKSVAVVMPLRDRNGDPVAAVRVVMDRFAGQTESTAISRARPIVKLMEYQIQTTKEPFQ